MRSERARKGASLVCRLGLARNRQEGILFRRRCAQIGSTLVQSNIHDQSEEKSATHGSLSCATNHPTNAGSYHLAWFITCRHGKGNNSER